MAFEAGLQAGAGLEAEVPIFGEIAKFRATVLDVKEELARVGDDPRPAEDAEIEIDGDPVPVEISDDLPFVVGFDGEAEQRIGLGYTDVDGLRAMVRVIDPSGDVITTANDSTATSSTGRATLPTDGRYTIEVEPYDGQTGTAALLLTTPQTDLIDIDGPPVTVAIDRVGDYALLTFDGSEGQRVEFGLANADRLRTQLSLIDPSGDVIGIANNPMTDGSSTEVVLPVEGRYTIDLDPYDGQTGTADVRVVEAS